MEEIRNWWEVPSIAHFCSLFRAAFGLTDFEIEDLEDALLIDGSNEEGNNRFLADLHARLLRGLFGIKDITAENFEPYLSQVLKIRWVDELGKKNPLADREYSQLSTREKVEVLHNLCDFRLDVEDVPELLKGLDADSLRVEPLGFDAEGRTFWYFYGTRLYCEGKPAEPCDKPRKKSKKRKQVEPKTKKKKSKVKKKKKSKLSSSDSEPASDSSPSSTDLQSSEDDENDTEDDNEDEQEPGEKEELENKSRPSWSVICSTEQEWQQLAESFKRSKHRDEKLLYETLSVDFVPEIGKMIEAKDKAMRKKLLMELAPRRASDRIALKAQVREEEDQMEENEKQRERERLAEERKREEEERQREKQQQAERRQQERARRARMREERQWLMANGEFVPEELKLTCAKEDEKMESEGESRASSAVTSTILQQRAEVPGLEDRDEDLYTGMYKVMDALKKHNNAWPFLEPVEESYAPQYYEIIEQPMDLSTIEQKLDDSKYTNLNEFVSDMKLMFENCLEYNGPDSMYTKMANSLEAAFNRHLKKHFPEDDDNSDEDFEEELARKSKKDKKKRLETQPTADMFRGVSAPDEHHFQPKLTPSGMQSMFQNHMLPNNMTNGGMMPSHHPSRMPFPGPPHFAPDGRPLYPPQFYQNTFNPAAFTRFGMAQATPQYNRLRYPSSNPMSQMGQPSPFPPQAGMPGRLPFQFGMPPGGGHTLRENDMNGPNQVEQARQLSPQQLVPISTSGEPTPSAVTGGMERGRQPQQPHGASYYRSQSFNQPIAGYSRNNAMPYRGPAATSYSQSVIPGREPWRIDKKTPDAAPQRVPSANGLFGEEAQSSNPFPGSQHKSESSSDSDDQDNVQEQIQEVKRGSDGKESPSEGLPQPRSRVPATLSISHILSGASRDVHQQHGTGARIQQVASQVTEQGSRNTPPTSDNQVSQVPDSLDAAKQPNDLYDKFTGKGSHDSVSGRDSFGVMYQRGPHGKVPREGLDWKGPVQDILPRKESFQDVLSMKFSDRRLSAKASESSTKKAPHKNTPESSSSKKIPELRPIKVSYENTPRSEEEKSGERTLDSGPENGHLESGKTDRVSSSIHKQMHQEGARVAPYKNWPGIQGGTAPQAVGSFLQELNDVGPPSGNLGEKPVSEQNHRLPFTSLLKGIVPSQSSPVESQGQFVTLDAASRDRMRENMMSTGSYLRNSEEKLQRFNAAHAADVSPYTTVYASKRPSEMMPPLQYRPNMSALAQQRNLEGISMPGSDSQFVDLNSMQFRHAPAYPSRDSLTREQMFFLEQQRRQQMTSSMSAMMAGGQPDPMLSYGGMLRQQQLFDAAYASHMRNGQYPGYPGEDVPAKMARYS